MCANIHDEEDYFEHVTVELISVLRVSFDIRQYNINCTISSDGYLYPTVYIYGKCVLFVFFDSS